MRFPPLPDGPRFYARDGSEITLEQWGALQPDLEYKRVAMTRFGDDLRVSTVWLGMDHAFIFEHGGPLIFETMIFGGGELDQMQWRYGTEAAALDGHAYAVELARMVYQHSLPDAEVERPVQVEDE